MLFSKPTTFREAMDYLNRKAILPTTGSSMDLQRLPTDIRNRSLFSARTAYVSHLATLDSVLAGIVAPPDTKSPDYMPGAYINPAKAKMILRQSLQGLGYDPEKAGVTPGSLKDLSSDRRIDLMIEMNTREIRGYGQYAQGRASQELLNEFPAQELIRVMERKEPRDWQERWVRKGGKLSEGDDKRMIALKTDPIWTEISAFARPFPPFDFGSGMGVRDIDRDEAIDLGIMQPDTILTADIPSLNDNLSLPTSIQSRSALADVIRNMMGDTIRFEGDTLTFSDSPSKAGSNGSHGFLGLPPISPAGFRVPRPGVSEIRAVYSAPRAVKDPSGLPVIMDITQVSDHWIAKGKNTEERLLSIRDAISAIKDPAEIWAKRDQRIYLSRLKTPSGKIKGLAVYTDLDGNVRSWHPVSTSEMDSLRSGTLVYARHA